LFAFGFSGFIIEFSLSDGFSNKFEFLDENGSFSLIKLGGKLNQCLNFIWDVFQGFLDIGSGLFNERHAFEGRNDLVQGFQSFCISGLSELEAFNVLGSGLSDQIFSSTQTVQIGSCVNDNYAQISDVLVKSGN
jgi:hypothetical protein